MYFCKKQIRLGNRPQSHVLSFFQKNDSAAVTKQRFSKQYMGKPTLSRDELIPALCGQDADRRKLAFRCLFDDVALRRAALTHVRRHGGNLQDGEDVFQEAIILFDRKIRQGAFLAQGSLEAYFMGIVRWHWFNLQQQHGRTGLVLTEHPPEPPPEGDPELEYLLTERREQLEKLLTLLTDKCQNILKLYQLDYTMEEIANALGYANSGVAKKEAFLCRQRFLIVLQKHPEIWQDLIKQTKL